MQSFTMVVGKFPKEEWCLQELAPKVHKSIYDSRKTQSASSSMLW